MRRHATRPAAALVVVALLVGIAPPRAGAAESLPVGAQNRHHTVPVDGSLTVTLLGSDERGDPLTIEVTSLPTHGQLGEPDPLRCALAVFEPDHVHRTECSQTVAYRPDAGYLGPDAFTYRVSDGTWSDDATVTIDVASSDAPPIARDDALLSWPEDAVGPVYDSLVGNDTDGDGDSLTVRLVTPPAHATVDVLPNDVLLIVPETDYWTNLEPDDVLTYAVSDGVAEATATIPIRFVFSDDPPSFTPGGDVTVDEDAGAFAVPSWASDVLSGPPNERPYERVAFTVSAADPTLFAVQPTVDEVYPWDAPAADLRFTPAPGAYGSTMVTVVPTDLYGSPPPFGVWTGDPVSFTITVGPINDQPTLAAPTAISAPEDWDSAVAVLGTPITVADEDFTPPWVAAVPPPERHVDVTVGAMHGTLTITDRSQVDMVAGDGIDDATMTFRGYPEGVTTALQSMRYRPFADYDRTDEITIAVDDGGVFGIGGPATAAAAIEVSIVPNEDGPVAVDDVADVPHLGTTTIDVLANDSDVDSDDTLTVVAVSAAAKGAVAISPGGASVTYHPNRDATGEDAFDYTISDGGWFARATVHVTIGANSPPIAADDAVTIAEDAGPTTIDVLANDGVGPDEGELLAIIAVSQGSKGAVTVADGGTALTYAPSPDANGADTFSYTIDDGHGGTDTATVSVDIAPVNDPPMVTADSATVTAASGPTAVDVLANDGPGPNEPGDAVTISAIAQGSRGTVTITGGGTGLRYDPGGCATGTDTFTYTVTDGGGLSATATVSVTIVRPVGAPRSDAPRLAFPTGATIGSTTVPVRATWCATSDGHAVSSYPLALSTAGGTYATVAPADRTSPSARLTLRVGGPFRFRARAIDNRGHASPFAYGPTFRVARLENTSGAITYAGAWSTSTTASASGGSERYTTRAGARASLTFTGSAFAIVGPQSATRGTFTVWIDGARVATVSERTGATLYRRILFARGVSPGTHAVVVEGGGQGRIDLDAILVIG